MKQTKILVPLPGRDYKTSCAAYTAYSKNCLFFLLDKDKKWWGRAVRRSDLKDETVMIKFNDRKQYLVFPGAQK